MTAAVGGKNPEVLGEGRQVRCPREGGCGSTVNEQQWFALAVDIVIDPKSVGLDVRCCGYHQRQLSSMDRYSMCGMLAVGYSLRDDLGDVLGGVEVGGEPVLGQRERGPGPGVGVGVAPAHAPHPEDVLCLVRVGHELTNGVAQPPRSGEAEDLVGAAHRYRRYFAQPSRRDQ